MFFNPTERLFESGERFWFPSGPFIFSLLLHGVMAFFLMTWASSHPTERISRVVTIQIVEEKKEIAPDAPPPSRPKQQRIQEIVLPKPEPQPVAPPKEEGHPFPPILQPVEQKILPALPVTAEKVGVEEKPKEEWMEKVEPGRWGAPEAPEEVEPLPLAIEKPGMSLTANSGPAEKGVPGGIAAINLWGKGAGSEAGFPGGVEGGEGKIPPRGAKTGSVHFQGEGIGRGDLGSYLGHARMRIEKAKRYPREARRWGWEGRVVLSFQINREGEVAQIRLVQSSGYQELDQEGIATIRRASPFLPLPMTEERALEVEIPLLFRLEERR